MRVIMNYGDVSRRCPGRMRREVGDGDLRRNEADAS
jgi:hypothetical protein